VLRLTVDFEYLGYFGPKCTKLATVAAMVAPLAFNGE
jgi:hypothetical protein